MTPSSVGKAGNTSDWGSDFFGTLNEMPPEPVIGIGHILEAMGTLSAFRDARDWVLRRLGISQGSSVIEAGCGNAAALSGVRSTIGTKGGCWASIQPGLSLRARARGPNNSA
jgi:hypothetical protein